MAATPAAMPANGHLKRYLFEQGFHADAAPPPPPAPDATYSAGDLARERAAGFAEGRAAGLKEAGRAGEVRLATALEAVAEAMPRALSELDAVRTVAIGEAVAGAAAIAAKLLPALYRREAASEIEAVVAEVLPKLFEENRVAVRVNPADLPPLAERLAIIAERAGFADRLMVSADGSIAAGDCRIDWGSGGAERDGERLWREIESILAATAPLIEALAPDGRLRLTAQPAPTSMSEDNSTGDSDA
jgi:flagellar assembly protein FliH